MIRRRSSPCDNRKKISAVRDLPYRCGIQSNKNQSERGETLNGSVDVSSVADHSNQEESFGLVRKESGFSLAATRDFPYGCGSQSRKNQGIRNGAEVVSASSENGQSLSCSEDSSGCVSGVADQYYRRRKEEESFDLVMKKAGFNLAANSNAGSGRFVATKRRFTSTYGSKVKPLSSEEAIKLMPSHGSRRPLSYSSGNIQRKHWPVYKHRYSPKTKNLSNAASFKAKTHRSTPHRERLIPAMQQSRMAEALTPREKVLEVLRLFNLHFEALDRDKAARRRESKTATRRVDYLTRRILINNGVQVNNKKMIGPVPGVEVGDEFQFKSELNLVGLHFDIRGGIDYINEGDLKLATSIVESEGNGYGDRFDSEVMIYSGQGGNVTCNDPRAIEDQKLVTGNLALANSMKAKSPVRVIRGRKRVDQRGKRYVYDGLYLVVDYWRERGPGGNLLFKFKLCRVSGQPSVDLRH